LIAEKHLLPAEIKFCSMQHSWKHGRLPVELAVAQEAAPGRSWLQPPSEQQLVTGTAANPLHPFLWDLLVVQVPESTMWKM
jgi:hypothetical protein